MATEAPVLAVEAPANGDVEEIAANGLGAAPEQSEGEAASPPAKGEAGAPQEDEEPWRKRLWIVRMPRPPEAGSIKALEQDVDTFRTQFNLITEALNVKKVERDGAREASRSAREAYNQCRAAFDERFAPVKELQAQKQEIATSANKLKDSFSDLLVKSEAELDEQLRGLHYRIEHESITLNEEKKALATIKTLEKQRERVREYEASASLFAETRAKRSELQDILKEHDGELKALRAEMDMQRQILDKLRDAERAVDAEVQEVVEERRRCRELMEQAYQRMTEAKKEKWEKNNTFYSNRGLSRDIRKMVADGKLEEARDACAEQQEEAHEQLQSNDAFRAEYYTLWETQRKTFAGAEEELPPLAKGGKGGKGGKREEPVDPAKKAEATIAALLEEAKKEAHRTRAAAAEQELAGASAAAAAAAAAEAATAAEAAPAGGAPAVHAVVGLEAEVAAEAARAAARAAKPKAAPPPRVVEPVVVPPENFELPEAARLKDRSASSQELKELERERNRQAQAESERRKAKKQQEKERKKQRQEALAREAAAAATRAAEAATAAQAAAAAAVAAVTDDANASDSASDGGAAPHEVAAAAAPAQLEQRKKGGAAGSSKPARKPQRPAPAKQRGAVQQAKKAVKENQVVVALGVALLFALMLLSLFWTAKTVPQ